MTRRGHEMSELVEYGFDDCTSLATMWLQITRREAAMTTDGDDRHRPGEQRSFESPVEWRANRCGDHGRIEPRQDGHAVKLQPSEYVWTYSQLPSQSRPNIGTTSWESYSTPGRWRRRESLRSTTCERAPGAAST